MMSSKKKTCKTSSPSSPLRLVRNRWRQGFLIHVLRRKSPGGKGKLTDKSTGWLKNIKHVTPTVRIRKSVIRQTFVLPSTNSISENVEECQSSFRKVP
ncbi:hypothetical protein CEXT_801041 [Caerostris extrusa]|uniref:Uncharacterized protein n=1 Tax=Caerostris extrusa TaxID=172846 RepID=A0AAV4NCS4_CAEEX|nr:hypothetical protein CEXT_801041 [Caerostris extrusa]